MNLALQKRHEQLERWRQNEANVELIEKQQQAERSKSSLRSPTVHHINRSRTNVSRGISFNKDISSSLEDECENDPTSGQPAISSTDRSRTKLIRHNKSLNSVDSQADLSRVKFTHSTLFLDACANGNLDECKRMLDDKLVEINVTTCDGLTGLHEAAICGNCELATYLLGQGANVNCCDNEGWTPLHAAASLGQLKIVELLLGHGADATIVNCENFLALDLARTDEVRELIADQLRDYDLDQLRRQEELMIERDIERWIKTGHYEERSHPITKATVLHVLAAKGYVDLMERILGAPALKGQINLEARDSEGFTPLLAASFWNQADMVQLLIENGANIFAQANSGYKISSIHLKNYQQSKLIQPQSPQTATRTNRSSLSSIDSENASQSDYSRKSAASPDSFGPPASEASTTDYEDSIGDNIPSGSARHLRSQHGQLSKSKSLELGSGKQEGDDSPLLHGSMSVDRLLLRADSMGERDLRKSFKELVMENERLKQQLKGFDDKDKQRQQDWIRRERQLHRKISELEEENKQIEHWKQEIQRLKDENNSLIRVVSKLTKQHH